MTTSRRGHNEGGIRKRADGRWEASIDLGYQDGKRRRHFFYGKTRAEAARKLREAQHKIGAGVPLGDSRQAVATLLSVWLELQRSGEKSPNTIDNYEWAINTYLVPQLGRIPVNRLQPEHVDELLQQMAARGLARNSVVRVRSVLCSAIHHAERRGLVEKNVAELAEIPRCAAKPERRALTVEQGRSLLVSAAGDRLEALVVVGLTTGLRPGELTGLRWVDVDLEHARITVSGSMKRESGELRRGEVKRSRAGLRTIDIPRMTTNSLADHRRRQAAERLAAGPAWSDSGLVFSTTLGGALDPSNVRRTFARIGERAGIGPSFPYELRHTVASHLIDAGRGVEEVADLLGNDPRTLYRHYRHRTKGSADAAAGVMEGLFGTAPEEFGGQFGGQTGSAGATARTDERAHIL